MPRVLPTSEPIRLRAAWEQLFPVAHARRDIQGQRATFFYLPCGSLNSLAAAFLNMLVERFDGGAPIAP
jgi:hypothetical protein